MKYSSTVIYYFSYMMLFWKAKLDNDYEKIDYYRKEMRNTRDKMNIDDLLEIVTIMDAFYSDRQR